MGCNSSILTDDWSAKRTVIHSKLAHSPIGTMSQSASPTLKMAKTCSIILEASENKLNEEEEEENS